MPRTLLWAAALSAAALLLAGPERCRGAGPSTAEQKIEGALRAPTRLEFIETPLQDVVDYLKDYHRIEIQIDRKALEDVELDPSTTAISTNLEGISLRSALNLVLRDNDLTYLIQDEVLLITTVKDAAGRMTTRVYPVDDIVGSVKKPDEGPAPCQMLIQVITMSVAPQSWAHGPMAAGGYGMGGYGPGVVGGMGRYPAAEYDGAGGRARKKAEQAPKGSIADASFAGRPMLVVLQTYRVHHEIAALLKELRNVAGCKRPTPAKADKKPAAPTPAKPPREPAAAPAGDPFSEGPAPESPGKGSSSSVDDPFGK